MANADDFIRAVGSGFSEFTFTVTDDGQISADSTGEQMIGPFEFCVTFLGRDAFTLRLMSPSPEAAAATVGAMVRTANQTMPGWAASAGACPSGV
jgi:hypothetical protein